MKDIIQTNAPRGVSTCGEKTYVLIWRIRFGPKKNVARNGILRPLN